MNTNKSKTKIYCNVSNHDITKKEFKTIQKRMHKNIENDGLIQNQEKFLFEGEKLKDVIEKDKIYLDSVSITFEQIAGRLETLIEKFYHMENLHYSKTKKLQNNYIIEDKYEINYDDKQNFNRQCPFQNVELDNIYYGYSHYGKFSIINLQNKKQIQIDTVQIHMIKCHNFFGGPKSSQRL